MLKKLENKTEIGTLDIKEGFDGIRKSNSRIIFTILLGIIILDFAYECMQT